MGKEIENDKVLTEATSPTEAVKEEGPPVGVEAPVSPPPETVREDVAAEEPTVPPPEAEPESAAAEEPEPIVPQPKEGRFKRLPRRILFWAAGLLIVFALGCLLAVLTMYQPTSRELRRANQELEEANQRIVELETQVTELTTGGAEKQNQLEALETEKQNLQQALEDERQNLEEANQRIEELEGQLADLEALKAEKENLQNVLEASQLHAILLRILADVNAARFALLADDADSAGLYLSPTPNRLQELADLLGTEHEQVATAMQQRLELITGELKRDREAAQADLNLLSNSLLQLENTFFVAP